MAAILEQYRISDFLEWYNEKKLLLNPDFQRGSVWTPAARSYLVDTILRELPIPKIYLRTQIDLLTQRSIREVVDGQQRLRAIIDFANDRFALDSRTNEYIGKRYSTLDPEMKEVYLSYPIAVGQLLNASDADVLEVFARLNSYNVTLNAPEKRHAKYQGDFKWAVRNMSVKWEVLWTEYEIVKVRQRVRMLDDSLMAELFGVVLQGVTDGGQPKIDRLYNEYDKSFEVADPSIQKVDEVLRFITENFADDLENTPILSSPHFLMLFSAVAHALFGIPSGDMGSKMPDPDRERQMLEIHTARSNLLQLATVIESDEPVSGYESFWTASKSSTQRISTRQVRFPAFYDAITE